MHTYFDRGRLIPSFGLGAKRMELPLEKLLEESPRLGGVCGTRFQRKLRASTKLGDSRLAASDSSI